MHPAVDAFVFSPLPRTPRRVLDVYSYGRRSPVTHEALLRLVEQEGLTYLYDAPGPDYRDRREHRQLVANMMKRTRYFVAHDINDSPERLGVTGGEEALSTRYVEGAAGGAVLLGSRPHAPVFDDAFPSLDALVALPYDEPDVADVLADLDNQPERLARIRADNVRGILARHDWAYRWQTILDDVGLRPLPGIEARLAGLTEMADSARPERFQA
jgi:hypothetical protein